MADKEAMLEMQKTLYREQLMKEHFYKRGGQLKPFNIQPFPYDRERLNTGRYDDEARKIRKQWLEDQKLTEREPVMVKEWNKKNIFRRMYITPWDKLFDALRPILGQTVASHARFFIPKTLAGLVFAWFTWYHIKYNPNDWSKGPKSLYTTQLRRPHAIPGVQGFASPGTIHPNYDDFFDKGFKSRKVLTGDKFVTSSVPAEY